MDCKSCASLSGKKRISPGRKIYSGNYWVIEHAYPTSIRGWLVLVLKRHATSLHDLTPSEFAEMTVLQNQIIKVLHECFHSEKEYMAMFAESEGFEHIHVHFIPRGENFPSEYKGSKVFRLIGKITNPISPEDVITLCHELSEKF